MRTTVRLKASQIYKDWHVIDAADRPLGRVASEAAVLLRGKHKPTFEKHLDGGDFVIIVNAARVRVTGRKEEQIKYYTHSGYPGGLRTRTFAQQMARFPDRVVEQAVWGMLPGGTLGKKILRHLKVYAGPNHPHASQIAQTATMQAARAEAEASLATAPRTAPGLRPLSIPQGAVADQSRDRQGAEQPPVAEPIPAPAKPRTRRAKAPAAPEATLVAEAEASTETVILAEAPVSAEDATADEAAVAAVARVDGIVEEKPKRVRKTAATTKTEVAADAAPRPRSRKPKVADETADGATEEKKPARRRAAPKKSEE